VVLLLVGAGRLERLQGMQLGGGVTGMLAPGALDGGAVPAVVASAAPVVEPAVEAMLPRGQS